MSSNRLYYPTPAPGAAGSLALNTQGGIAAAMPANQIVAGTTETVIVNPSLPTAPLLLSIPPNSPLDGKQFELLASGWLNHGASLTATINLYSGSSLTVGSDTLLKSSGASGAFSGKANWFLKAKLIFDSTSGKLTGTVQVVLNNVILLAEAVLANVPTGLSNTNSTGAAVINFLLSITFGTGNAANQISVQEFAINF